MFDTLGVLAPCLKSSALAASILIAHGVHSKGHLAQGVHSKAIQELLRHSSIQVTMDVYAHLFDSTQRETADKMDEVMRGKTDESQAHKVSAKV